MRLGWLWLGEKGRVVPAPICRRWNVADWFRWIFFCERRLLVNVEQSDQVHLIRNYEGGGFLYKKSLHTVIFQLSCSYLPSFMPLQLTYSATKLAFFFSLSALLLAFAPNIASFMSKGILNKMDEISEANRKHWECVCFSFCTSI